LKRSPGITVSAILVFFGSGLTLLFALMMALVVALLRAKDPSHGMPQSVAWSLIILYSGLSAWGIATGVGLLRLREWGRVSLIIFAVFLAFGTLGAASIFLFMNFPIPANDPNPAASQQLVWFFKVGMAIFFAALAALGIWWLYYFNQRAIREEFRNPQFLPAPLPAFGVPSAPPLSGFVVPSAAAAPARPVSISVIAAMSLIGAAMLPINLLYRAPLLLCGYLISGWRGFLFAVLLSGANVAAGVGLFKLKLWARTLAIGVAIFGLINSLATILIPGSQARWDQYMQSSFAKWGLPPTTPMPHWPVWLLILPVVPFALAEIYFLVIRKPAFLAQMSNAPIDTNSANF
jgi:hypothetical protein